MSLDKIFQQINYLSSKKQFSAKKPVVVESAFRANKITPQTYTAFTSPTVTFESKQFDFGNEYANPIFIPNQSGVYSIAANVFFDGGDNYGIELDILINGSVIASDLRESSGFSIINVSTIYGLNAGDNVSVRLLATVNGIIQALPGRTHFEAARFPFMSSVPLTAAQNSLTSEPVLKNDTKKE